MKHPLLFVALLLSSGLAISQGPLPKNTTSWSDWSFLLGEWISADSNGVPGAASKGWFSLTPDLDGKILVRKNHAEYPPSNGRPGIVHDDLMIVYREGDATKAFYDDNEGHVIRYSVSVSADKRKIVFASEKAPGTPQYRLTYENLEADVVKLAFEIAPPDKPDQFTRYVEATVKRKK
jgi:hypothetical protein